MTPLNIFAVANATYKTYGATYNDIAVSNTDWGVFIIWLLIWGVFWGAITQAVGTSKRRKNQFWWGFLLGFVGLIIVLCLPNGNDDASTTAKRETSELNKLEYLEKLQIEV